MRIELFHEPHGLNASLKTLLWRTSIEFVLLRTEALTHAKFRGKE